MLKKIESLRTKPKEVRNRYAFWSAFGFTAIIAVFWVASVSSRVGILTGAQPEEKMEVEGGVSRSFSEFRASVADGVSIFNTIKEGAEVANEEPAEASEGEIDFSMFFGTSTPPVAVVKKQGKSVLISTTSQSRSTSTEN